MTRLGLSNLPRGGIRPDELARLPASCPRCGGRLVDADADEIGCIVCGWRGYIIGGRVQAPRRERRASNASAPRG
jgi:ribosomal protein S27AE